MVELLFLPSVYAPCPVCKGTRYNPKTLEITYRGKSIADVLGMTVDGACDFFDDEPAVRRSLTVLCDVGLQYLRLGQPATEFSGGEAQRIKLATELQRPQRGDSLYILDEPTTGLHPAVVAVVALVAVAALPVMLMAAVPAPKLAGFRAVKPLPLPVKFPVNGAVLNNTVNVLLPVFALIKSAWPSPFTSAAVTE